MTYQFDLHYFKIKIFGVKMKQTIGTDSLFRWRTKKFDETQQHIRVTEY